MMERYWQGKAGLSRAWHNGRCGEEMCSVIFRQCCRSFERNTDCNKKKLTSSNINLVNDQLDTQFFIL